METWVKLTYLQGWLFNPFNTTMIIIVIAKDITIPPGLSCYCGADLLGSTLHTHTVRVGATNLFRGTRLLINKSHLWLSLRNKWKTTS